MSVEQFQNLVIGSGVAGKRLAWTLARQGKQTVVVERTMIGADDGILGFTAFGAEASEIMDVAQTAMLGGMPYTALRDTIGTHPNAAEGLLGLFPASPSLPAWDARLRGNPPLHSRWQARPQSSASGASPD